MKCTVKGCPGEYEDRRIVHTLHRGSEILVFEHVPAQVCSVCGDTLLEPETLRHLEKLLEDKGTPRKLVPLYEYP